MTHLTAIRRVMVVAQWAVISIVGVAMAAFIVFDVLDLDGSNLRHPPTGSAVTADSAGNEAARLLCRAPDPSTARGGELAAIRLPLPIRPGVTRPGARQPVFRPHRTVLRAQTWQDTFRGTTSNPADPA